MAWSPQRYVQAGVGQGYDRLVLERAAAQIDDIHRRPPHLPALLSLKHLSVRTGTNYRVLRRLVSRTENFPYHSFHIRKRSGGHRTISVPNPTLMDVQRWLTVHVLNKVEISQNAYAFKPGSSIVKCAARHCGARWLIKMDVTGFFSSISEIHVFRIFRELGYQPLVAFELARLTTLPPLGIGRWDREAWRAWGHSSPISSYQGDHIGFLPQGAPTSPMLSNLAMRSLDRAIQSIAESAGLEYTRYSDDITFSTRSDFDRSKASAVMGRTSAVLRRIGLYPNPGKSVVVPPGGRKVVLGLLVDHDVPALPREFRSRLRQHLHYLETLGPLVHASKRGFDSVWGLYRHVRGLIDFANMVDPAYSAEMLSRLNAVPWPHDP
jgi:RNA-directed DNA polymerase